jgi:hypothetical protein
VSGAGRDREVGEERILGFFRSVRHETMVAVDTGKFDGVQRFADGADLVELDQDGVSDALLDSLGENFRIRAKDVVAD